MPTAASMLEAFANNFPGLIQALTMAAYVLGMWCGISGVYLDVRSATRLSPTSWAVNLGSAHDSDKIVR